MQICMCVYMDIFMYVCMYVCLSLCIYVYVSFQCISKAVCLLWFDFLSLFFFVSSVLLFSLLAVCFFFCPSFAVCIPNIYWLSEDLLILAESHCHEIRRNDFPTLNNNINHSSGNHNKNNMPINNQTHLNICLKR